MKLSHLLLASAVVAMSVGGWSADAPKTHPVKAVATVAGSVADEAKQGTAPTLIVDAVALKDLWTNWGIAAEQPEVDFTKQFVVVSTTVGSVLHTSFIMDDKGNLQNVGMATMDIREGFRYSISVLNREGVNTVDGKPLPAVPAPAPDAA